MNFERFDPVGEPTPPAGLAVVQGPTQLHIDEATQPSPFAEVPVAPFIADGSSNPTTVLPVQAVPVHAAQVHAAQPVAHEPLPPANLGCLDRSRSDFGTCRHSAAVIAQ